MTPPEIIVQIAELLLHHFNGESTWDDCLLVKSSPHTEIARLYGAVLEPETGKVWLRNNDSGWYELNAEDRNFNYVSASVLQRLKYLKLMQS